MGTPAEEIQMLKREYLESEDAEFFRFHLAFAVARRIVQYHDPDLLQQMPDWVGDVVREMCEAYRVQGSYIIVSNVGEADHTAMVAELTRILGIDHAEPKAV